MSDDIDRLAMELQHGQALDFNKKFDLANSAAELARFKKWREDWLKKMRAESPEDYANVLAYERIGAETTARRKHIKAVLMASLVPRCPF